MRNGKATPHRTVLLSAAAILTALLGAWLLLSPRLESDAAQQRQDALLASVIEDTITPEEDTAETTETTGTVTAETQPSIIAEPEASENEPVTEAAVEEIVTEPALVAETEPEPESASVIAEPIDSGVEGGIGVLTIGRIDLRMPVTDGASKEQLKIAAGWVPQTAAIGAVGNAVIAGHRQYEYGRQFNRLGELELGDVMEYQSVDDERMAFAVCEIIVAEPGDVTVFAQPMDGRFLSLYTCTPIRTATHRLIVRGLRIY